MGRTTWFVGVNWPNNGMHPTPHHAASHARCVGARVMPGVRRSFLCKRGVKMLLKTAGGLSLILALNFVVLAKGWRGIVPLHSTRADVEQLLGAPNRKSNNKS